jgi:hypothetical protein
VANTCRRTLASTYRFGYSAGFCTIVMSLLPIAVVVVAFLLLFRLLGEKAEKVEQPQVPQAPRTPSPTPSGTPKDRHSQESAPQPASLDGLASFRFESKSHSKPATIISPRRHPCRVCGVPSVKRCYRCKSVYYCSKEHSAQASPRCVQSKCF